MPKKPKIPVTYVTTRPAAPGHPQPVSVRAERSQGSAQLCWLHILGPDGERVIFLDHATAMALWTQLGPIVRDQRTEQAILEAFVESDRARGLPV
jgi:hypothetical protein